MSGEADRKKMPVSRQAPPVLRNTLRTLIYCHPFVERASKKKIPKDLKHSFKAGHSPAKRRSFWE